MDESEKLAKAQKLSEKAQVPFEEARTALEQIDDAFSIKLIHTVRGVGYVIKSETR